MSIARLVTAVAGGAGLTIQLGVLLLAFGVFCLLVMAWVWWSERRHEARGLDIGPTVSAELDRVYVHVDVWEPAPRYPTAKEELADLELEYGRPFTVGQARELRRREAARRDVEAKLGMGNRQ